MAKTQIKYSKNQKSHDVAKRVAAISTLLIWLVIGTAMFRWMEDWSWIDSFYFTVSTLATVGYGDLHPTTDMSRLFTAIFILTGVGITVTALGVIGSVYIDNRARRIAQEDNFSRFNSKRSK